MVGPAALSSNNHYNIKYYTHVFIFDTNMSSTMPTSGSTISPIKAFPIDWTLMPNIDTYIQGAEIANNRIYMQLGGLYDYFDSDQNIILEYTFNGAYIQTHQFEINKVISVDDTVHINDDVIKSEYEGLAIKNGKLLSQVFYNYGDPFDIVERDYKSLVYEVFDTTTARNSAKPRLDVIVECTGFKQAEITAIASARFTNNAQSNIEIYVEDTLVKQGSKSAMYTKQVYGGGSATFQSRIQTDGLNWSTYEIKSGSSNHCYGSSGGGL